MHMTTGVIDHHGTSLRPRPHPAHSAEEKASGGVTSPNPYAPGVEQPMKSRSSIY